MNIVYLALGAMAFVAFVFVMMVIGIYNTLVRLKNHFKNNYAQIDVQLQRRYDLIPNLVETAKGYMSHEKDTLERVIQARNQAHKINVQVAADPTNPDTMKELAQAEQTLTKSMGGFFALAESYPELKADGTMKNLMEELTSTENKVGFARQAFNDSVMSYNIGIQEFPNNILAGMFNFREANQLELTNEEAKEAVKVSF